MSDASRTQLEQGKRAPRDSWQLAAAAIPGGQPVTSSPERNPGQIRLSTFTLTT
jgi:hypothetical protein